MNATSHSAGATDTAPTLRVVLTPDHHVTTVALDLVRAAAEYQTRVNRKEDTTGLVVELSERFNIDQRLGEALLAGKVKAEIEGDQLVVKTNPLESDIDRTTAADRIGAQRGARCTALPPGVTGPDERARRMQSVMLMHAAARGANAQGVASLANVCEFLCDLRHWCDEHMVDIYKAMDQAYIRYMHDKYRGLTPDSH
jgi:hypothetical protein